MIRSLQTGRGLAALAVTAFHLSLMFGDPRYGGGPVFDQVTGRGNLGVDFFFVLSGFIIMMAHRSDIGKSARVGSFVLRRFIRVYPLYWIFTALILLGASITGGSNTPPDTIGDLASTISLIRFTSYPVPLGPAWTLFFEVLFYGMFALLIANRRLGLIAWGLWFSVVLINFERPEHGHWNFWNTLTSTSNLNFVCGIFAYYLADRLNKTLGAASLLCGIIALPIVFLLEPWLGRGAGSHIGYGAAFLFLIAGAVALEREGRMIEIPGLGMLGNASYTLYLSHESVGSALLKILSKLGLMSGVDHRLLYVVVLGALIFFAVAFYWAVERPMLLHLRRLFESRPIGPRTSINGRQTN